MGTADPIDPRERLLSLVMELLHTEGPMTAEKLWEKVPGYARIDNLPAFRRAFERDKDVLRRQGLPLVVEPVPTDEGTVDGYRIDRDSYYINIPPLEPGELAALRMALELVDLGGVEADDGLLRLGGLVAAEDGVTDVPVADLTAPVAGVGIEQVQSLLLGAAANGAKVTFVYGEDQRTVDPWSLAWSGRHWYLTGFDHLRGERRVFRVDRIDGEVVVGPSGSIAELPDGDAHLPDPVWRWSVDPPVVARIRVDADQARWAIAQVGPHGTADWEPDGSVVLTLEVTNREGLRWLVLDLLEHAELLEPPELRASVVSWLEALA